MAKVKSKRRSPFFDLVKLAVFTLLLLFSVSEIVSTQAEIAEQKAMIQQLTAEIEETKAENDEYLRILGAANEEDYMLTIAVEKLGYAYPRERRFYGRIVG